MLGAYNVGLHFSICFNQLDILNDFALPGFLAVLDASTLGEFRKYAIQWQLSAACEIAGFFGVLSSELSVFTLAVVISLFPRSEFCNIL